MIGALQRFSHDGRFQEFVCARERGESAVEMLGAGLEEGKARSPGGILPLLGQLRFEIRGDAEKFVGALADAVRIAPDRVELNDQNVVRGKPIEVRLEMLGEASEV